MARDQERIKAYKKAKRIRLREEGICLHCEKVKTDKCLCDGCLEKQKERQRKDAIEREKTGLCWCGNERREGRKQCENCIARADVVIKKYIKSLRIRVIAGYGGQCKCCGENTEELLELDHINGDGAEHRKTGLSSTQLYKIVERAGFPNDYQILCVTCNKCKRRSRECPHANKARSDREEILRNSQLSQLEISAIFSLQEEDW